jgi:hypothetical protein
LGRKTVTGLLLRRELVLPTAPHLALDLVSKALSEAVIQVHDRIPKQWQIESIQDDGFMANLSLDGVSSNDSLVYTLDVKCETETDGNSRVQCLYTAGKSNPSVLSDICNKTHAMLSATLS